MGLDVLRHIGRFNLQKKKIIHLSIIIKIGIKHIVNI